METLPLPGFAGTCGQSPDPADKLRTKPHPIIVSFSDVGRGKRSWSKQFKQGITTADIAREAKRGAGLMSSDVDAELNDSGSMGHIIVGGFRVVGAFSITPA